MKDKDGFLVPPVNPESPGTLTPGWWEYWCAIQNAPSGAVLVVGKDDPAKFLLKVPASEVGLPEGWK